MREKIEYATAACDGFRRKGRAIWPAHAHNAPNWMDGDKCGAAIIQFPLRRNEWREPSIEGCKRWRRAGRCSGLVTMVPGMVIP